MLATVYSGADGKPYLKRLEYSKHKFMGDRLVHRTLFHSTYVEMSDGPVSPKDGKKLRELVNEHVNEDDLKAF